MGRREESIKKILTLTCIFVSLLIVISVVVLLTDIEKNKGIVPFIFFLTVIFFLSYIINEIFNMDKSKKKSYLKSKNTSIINRNIIINFIWLVMSVISFLISIYAFWM